MRKLSANLILPVSSAPLRNGIITLDDSGRITDLQDTGGRLREERALEFHNGVIVPGFILPWFVTHDPAMQPAAKILPLLKKLDMELPRCGIKGIGLVLSGENISDVGFKRMSASETIYHPILELCPGPEEEHFEVLNRGIELVSLAFNRFNLPCSLTACSRAMKGNMGKYLREYAEFHENVSPPAGSPPGTCGRPLSASAQNPLNIINRLLHPDKEIAEVISAFTLDAAAAIFEQDELGSIEPGKRPGINLIQPTNTLKVLV